MSRKHHLKFTPKNIRVEENIQRERKVRRDLAENRALSHTKVPEKTKGEMLANWYKFPVVSSGDLIYSMETTANNCIIYLKVANRLDLKCSHH